MLSEGGAGRVRDSSVTDVVSDKFFGGIYRGASRWFKNISRRYHEQVECFFVMQTEILLSHDVDGTASGRLICIWKKTKKKVFFDSKSSHNFDLIELESNVDSMVICYANQRTRNFRLNQNVTSPDESRQILPWKRPWNSHERKINTHKKRRMRGNNKRTVRMEQEECKNWYAVCANFFSERGENKTTQWREEEKKKRSRLGTRDVKAKWNAHQDVLCSLARSKVTTRLKVDIENRRLEGLFVARHKSTLCAITFRRFIYRK